MRKRKVGFNWPKWLGLGAGLLLVPSIFLNIFFFQKKVISEQGIKVVSILDGDTLVIEGTQRVKLIMVDSPEIDLCLGEEAKEKLESLVEGKDVILKEPIVDNFGRIMALVYVDDLLVNQEILSAGLGRFEGRESQVREKLELAYKNAREGEKGIFSPICHQVENFDNSDCLIKGNIDKADGKRYYHLPECPQYSQTIVEKDLGEDWFCSEREAKKAGFVKSKTCS